MAVETSDFHMVPPPNPGAGATAILLDTTIKNGTTLKQRGQFPAVKRVVVAAFIDQAATLFVDWLAAGSTTWRPYDPAGYAITASTFFQKDVLLLGDDTRIRIVTGTAPTVWEVSGRQSQNRGLGE